MTRLPRSLRRSVSVGGQG